MLEQGERIGFGTEGFVLVNQQGSEVAALRVGDTVELLIGNTWQRVRVQSGGYKGWYYMMPDGRMARFALSMLARGYQVASASVSAAREQEDVQAVQQAGCKGKRVRVAKRSAVVVDTPEIAQPDGKPVRRARRTSRVMVQSA